MRGDVDKLQKDWFERFQINFNEAPDGFLGIHAWKKGVACRYFEVPLEWADSDDFWGLLYERALAEWETEEFVFSLSCPICGRNCNLFHLRYKGKMFCRWCGSHYKLVGGKIIVTRSIIE
jgi:hypothetical protein